jgi:hypothetical protein
METDPEFVQRWRGLREMLIQQLDMFESGRLSLTADSVDISGHAMADLKRSIQDFDALICKDAVAAETAP